MRSVTIALGLTALLAACAPHADMGDSAAARYACEEFVKDSLKSPASADFSDQSETHRGPTWISRGSVDSQNSFGAKIRNDYACTVKYKGDPDGTYVLVSLKGLLN